MQSRLTGWRNTFSELPGELYEMFRWMLLGLFPFVMGAIFGALSGIMFLVWFVNTYSDEVVESWQYTEASGQVWTCHRALGMKAMCSQTHQGQLTYLREDDTPIFTTCDITQTTTLDH